MTGPRRSRRVAVTLALFSLSLGAVAVAHQGAVSLTFWADNFEPEDARCQVEVGDGAATCALGAWAIRRDCLLERLDGGTCDVAADDAAIEALRLGVFRGDIEPACRAANLRTLLFSDLQDVQFDVITFCRELEAAAVSAVFNPFFAAAAPGTLSDTDKQCIRAFAGIATKAFRYGFRIRKATLDRIANRRRSARIKKNDIAEADRRLAAAGLVLQQALGTRCDAGDFHALYGMTPAAATALLSSRSACLAMRTYPVVAFDCPAAVCGNGMRETNETCDDGNTTPGDGCSDTCKVEF